MYDELCETRRLVAALQARLDDQEARIAEQENLKPAMSVCSLCGNKLPIVEK